MAEINLSGGAAATSRGLAQTCYSQAELARILRWQEGNDRRRQAWRERQSRPGRNVGPAGCKRAWGDLPQRSTWHVVHDVALPGGTTLSDGTVIPQVGGFIRAEPLAAPFSSRRQGLKSLARLLPRVPDAYLVRVTREMSNRRGPFGWTSDRTVNPATLAVNEGAPDGWRRIRGSSGSDAAAPEKLR